MAGLPRFSGQPIKILENIFLFDTMKFFEGEDRLILELKAR